MPETVRRALIEVGIALALLALAFFVGLTYGSHRDAARASAAQSQSDQREGAARAAADHAAASDRQATHDQHAVTDADALAAAAKRELDRRLAALPKGAPASHLDHSGDATEMIASLPAVPSAPDELALTQAALAQAQAVIAAQGDQLAARDRLIASLTASRDQWKTAYEQSQEALALQRISYEARLSAQAKQGWKRTVGGLVVGALIGRAAK